MMYQYLILFIFLILNYSLCNTEKNNQMNEIIINAKKNISSDPLTKNYDLNNQTTKSISDAGDIVRNIPGISIPFDISASDSLVPYTNRGFSSYRVRGLGGNYVSLTIDGIRQPSQYELSGGMGRTFFDPSIYQSVSIRKGTGSSSSQSDAVAGTIDFQSFSNNLDLDDPSKSLSGLSRIRLKSVNNSINGLIKLKNSSKNQDIIFNSSVISGNERKNKKGNIPADPMDFDQLHHLLGLHKKVKNNSYFLNFEHFEYSSDVDFDHIETYEGFLIDTEPKVEMAKSKNKNQRDRVNFKFQKKSVFSDEFTINTYLQKSKSRNRTSEREILDPYYGLGLGINTVERDTLLNDIYFENNLYGVNIENKFYTHIFNKDFLIKSGFLSDLEDGNNIFKRSNTHEASDLEIQNGINPIVVEQQPPPNYFDPSKLYRNEIYFDSSLEDNDITYQVGLRYSDYKISPENNPYVISNSMMSVRRNYRNKSLTKSASITKKDDNFFQHLSFSEGIRNPSLENYSGYFTHGDYVIIPNPNLKPEEASTIQYNIFKNFSFFDFDISIFNSDYNNFFETIATGTNTTGVTAIEEQQIVNISESYIRGFEAKTSIYLNKISQSLDGFSLDFQYAGYKSKNKRTRQSLNAVSPKQYIVALRYDDPSMKFGSSLSVIHNEKKKNISDDWTYFVPPSSTVLDLNTYYYFEDNSLLKLSIRNLTDQKYWLWPNAGRVVHSFSEDKELSTMPGVNFILSYTKEI